MIYFFQKQKNNTLCRIFLFLKKVYNKFKKQGNKIIRFLKKHY